MIIIAGRLHVRAEERAAYLEAMAYVAPLARRYPGCLDFAQAADPLDPTRVNVYERWDDDEALQAFREGGEGGPDPVMPVPDVLDAEVRKYRVASVEDP